MYRNPFELEHEWVAYGIGDPFVLRWNGRYYLYPSTRTHGGGEVGVRVWVSEDLVDWRYAGYASRDRVTYNAFAPEVVYWNGSFYMYQSSDGRGHYVLKSDDPLGPFTAQTGNIGLSIDGSVFIDDDGSWYFTHAGFRGIRGYRMIDPYTVGTPRILEADMGAWTEGSMIIKRDGYYFITYTGNHIRSAGYRIDYAVAQDGPLGPYTVGENNPLLISTEDDFHGLGHNSLVLAPDLDGHMIVYHNIYNRHADHIRKMNIDRLVFNGRKMAALGPTRFPLPAPKMPEFYTWVDEDGPGDRWTEGELGAYRLLLSRPETGSRFTAEFNVQLEEAPQCGPASAGVAWLPAAGEAVPQIGAVVSYREGGGLVAVLVDPCEKMLAVWEVRGAAGDGDQGSEAVGGAAAAEAGDARLLGESRLPAEFDFTKLHTIRIAAEPGRMRVFLDQMLRVEASLESPVGGKIGYVYRDVTPVFRYTAFSSDAFGSSDRRVPKPVPGRIEAVHFLEEPSPAPSVIEAGDGTFAVSLNEAGRSLAYALYVEKDGLYAVDAVARNPADATLIRWQVNEETALTSAFPRPWPGEDQDGAQGGGWFKVPLGRLQLKAGLHTLRAELVQGSVELKRIDLYPVAEAAYSLVDPLTQGVLDHWREYGEGGWQSTEDGLRLTLPRDTMIIAGSKDWTDYTVRVELKAERPIGPGEVSLLLRATNASYYPEQVRDSVTAYAVTLKDDRIVLQKLNYGATTLAAAGVSVTGEHTLVVEAKGPVLRVFFDDMETPVLEYADPDAWMYGGVGLRANVTHVAFRNLSVHCASCPVFARLNVAGRTLWLTPNQKRYDLVLPFGVTGPPEVEVEPLPVDQQTRLMAPGAGIEVIPAHAVPGEARVLVRDPDGSLLHEAIIALSKITTPTVSVDVPGGEGRREGWAGSVAGDVPVIVEVDGPDELLRNVRVSLHRIHFGEAVDEKVLHDGPGVPVGLMLVTTEMADATYEVSVHVASVYDTEAEASLRFRVANWSETTDELLAPMESVFGVIDRSQTAARTDGWRHATDSPADFFGDRDRLVRTANTTEWLAWEANGPDAVAVTAYVRGLTPCAGASGPGAPDEGGLRALWETVALEVSADMNRWTGLPIRIESVRTAESGWTEVVLVGDVAEEDRESARFVRIVLREGALEPDAVQLGKVRLLHRRR